MVQGIIGVKLVNLPFATEYPSPVWPNLLQHLQSKWRNLRLAKCHPTSHMLLSYRTTTRK